MKKLLKSTLIVAAVSAFAISNVAIAQGPPTQTTTSTTPTLPVPTAGGTGGGLEIPGGGILDGAYVPEHLDKRKPIPYVHEREADIMWQRRIWRVIDLREKINHPLYYPDDTTSKRPALFWVIKKAVSEGRLNAIYDFDPFTNEFGTLFTHEEAMLKMTEEIGMKDSIGQPMSDSLGNQIIVHSALLPNQIAQYWLKEDWFFEKQRSVMDVRILAIAPVIEKDDPVQGKFSYGALFWIYYPALRDILGKQYCYNPYNDAEWRTFDEIFHKRLFSSFVRMESNVYNRSITAYLGGQSMEQLLEAERIKDDIFKIEHDMWNF